MPGIRLEIFTDSLKAYGALHVNQGEVRVARQPMVTILRSCVCAGFYHPASRIGAISHITGFRDEGGHGPAGALREIARELKRHELRLEDCLCFVVGGTEKTRQVFDATIRELDQRRIRYKVLDSLGRYHRKLLFDPGQGLIKLLKKSEESLQDAHRKTFHSDRDYSVFHDPRRRLVTGASLFFRNEHFLKSLREAILPGLLADEAPRMHVWCAGCSNGMEVYSLLMVALDLLERRDRATFPLKVLGTDISEAALATARQGIYLVGENAIQNHRALFKRFIRRIDARQVQMSDELRRRAVFRTRDIRQGSRGHRFELVLCDHVLQYFDEDIQREMLEPLARAVAPRGYLFVSTPSPGLLEEALPAQNFEHLARHLYRRKK